MNIFKLYSSVPKPTNTKLYLSVATDEYTWHISVSDVAPPMNIWGTRLPLWARLFVGYLMNISDRYRPDRFPYALTAATTHLNLLSSCSCPLTSSRRTPALPTAPPPLLAYNAIATAAAHPPLPCRTPTVVVPLAHRRTSRRRSPVATLFPAHRWP
jgi:hypothetical protein